MSKRLKAIKQRVSATLTGTYGGDAMLLFYLDHNNISNVPKGWKNEGLGFRYVKQFKSD